VAEFKCDLCGKSYKSKRSLRRHQKKVHGDEALLEASLEAGEVPLFLEDAGGREGAEAPAESEGTAEAAEASEPVESEPAVLGRALVDLGIEPENVMSFRVYPDRVVIIEGPVGFKRVWMMPGQEPASGAG
jgi:hypothetical protein